MINDKPFTIRDLTQEEKVLYREQIKKANEEAREIVKRRGVTINPRIVQARKEGKNV